MTARAAPGETCECDPRFTCGYCLRNAKPYFWTLSDGSAIAVTPGFGVASKLHPRDITEYSLNSIIGKDGAK